MNRAGEAQLSSTSDQNDAPRLGLLQCPNAESLGWAPSEPNSTVTSCAPSDDDDEVMPTLSSNNLNAEAASPQTKFKSTAGIKNEQFRSITSSLKRQRLNPSEEKAISTATPDACTNDGGAINDLQSDFFHTQQNDTACSNKSSDNTKTAVTAVLDYDTNSSDSLRDDGKRCQILTITLTPSLTGNKDDLVNASILVGTISGKAKLEVLPQTTASESSSSVSLDVLGYRISCNTSDKDNSIIIDRPDWMNSIPLTIITNEFSLHNNTSSFVLRVKLHSIHDQNDRSKQTSSDEDYYSAYAEETYNIKALSPNYIYPGNHTLCGLGVTTIMEQWETTLDALAQNVIADDSPLHNRKILICGAKGCGKSTMLRYATNRIISEQHKNSAVTKGVAILDLDCGQPELSVPGLVTLSLVSEPLLSDPPMHMVCSGEMDKSDKDGLYCPQQLGAYFFGDITSKSDPDKYIEMASLLLQRYHEVAKKWIDDGTENLPLLINTDGWVKGFGYEILCAIIEAANPRNIIQMLGTTKTKSFELPSQNVAEDSSRHRHVHAVQSFDENMIVIPNENDDFRSYRSMDSSNSTGPLQATASDHRIHRICVYFMGGYKKMINKRIRWLGNQGETISFHREKGVVDPNSIIGLSMAAMPPYAVPFHSVSLYLPPGYLDGVEEVESTFGTQGGHASEDALDALNGSIVGLCRGMDSTHSQNSSGVPNLHCVGLGIIRSIDRERKLFFVLTPVHPSLLSTVTVFVGGSIGLPLELVFRGAHADSFPFLSEHSLATPSLGGDVMKSRNHSGRKKN